MTWTLIGALRSKTFGGEWGVDEDSLGGEGGVAGFCSNAGDRFEYAGDRFEGEPSVVLCRPVEQVDPSGGKGGDTETELAVLLDGCSSGARRTLDKSRGGTAFLLSLYSLWPRALTSLSRSWYA